MKRLGSILIGATLFGCSGAGEPRSDTTATAAEAVTAKQPENFRELKTADGASQGVYAGGHPYKEGFAFFQGLGIRSEINLQENEEIVWDRDFDFGGIWDLESPEHKHADDAKIVYFDQPWRAIEVRDADYVDPVLALMADPNNRPIYVHCEYGADRTGAIVALHRVVNEGWMPDAAFHEWRANAGRCGKFRAPEETFNKKIRALRAANGDPAFDFQIAGAPDCYQQ